jgi:hypothetical protein
MLGGVAEHKGSNLNAMYRAIQVMKPGEIEAVMKPLLDLAPVKCASAKETVPHAQRVRLARSVTRVRT